MCGTTCLAIRNGPRTFTAITLSHKRDVDVGELGLLELRVERGVVDQDVDLAEALDGLGDQRLDLRLVADVADHAGGGVAAVLAGKLLRQIAAVGDVGDHHRGALGRERRRIVAPDAAGATGDDGAASVEPPHGQFLPVCLRTNFSNASSCSLTMSLVAWSVSSSEPSANFLAEKFTNTSGRISITASTAVRHWRR